MSPPRRAAALATTGEIDLLRSLVERMDAVEQGIAALREMLAARLTAVETVAAQVPELSKRLQVLEQAKARAEGALWLGRIGAVVLGGGMEWLLSRLTH